MGSPPVLCSVPEQAPAMKGKGAGSSSQMKGSPCSKLHGNYPGDESLPK